jgi:hypothetical protein
MVASNITITRNQFENNEKIAAYEDRIPQLWIIRCHPRLYCSHCSSVLFKRELAMATDVIFPRPPYIVGEDNAFVQRCDGNNCMENRWFSQTQL